MKKIPRLPNLPPPTNVFGKEVPMATWYECPKCLNQSPLTREWVGLTGEEARKFYEKYTDREELIYAIDKFLEDKNT